MRDFAQNPITAEEILSVLDTAVQRECDESDSGQVGPRVLKVLYDRLANNRHVMSTVFGANEHFDVKEDSRRRVTRHE